MTFLRFVDKCLAAMFAILFLCEAAHGDWFGNQTVGGLLNNIENLKHGGLWDATQGSPTSTGTVDSITAYLRAVGNDPPIVTYDCRCALYRYDSSGADGKKYGTLVDSTALWTLPSDVTNIDSWHSRPALIHATVTAGVRYMPVCWARSGLGSTQMFYASSTGDTIVIFSKTFVGNTWTTPAGFTASNSNSPSIYVTYTPTPTGSGRKRRDNAVNWKDAIRAFSGENNELVK